MITRLRPTIQRAFGRRSGEPAASARESTQGVIYDILAGVLIVAALTVAVRTTRDLRAPGDPDHFRDIAQAQTTRDGHPLSDPYYRGEWSWYNPLLAWTLALGSMLSGSSVEEFHVHAGPWLNLLGPIGFYALAVRLAGRRAAVAGLTLYLFFLTGNERSWASATYSPWLFADNFAQGLFFCAALALVRCEEDPSPGKAVIAGGLMGVTFLAHTAPALVLAVVACAVLMTRWRVLLVVGLTALIVASPFLAPIAFHYHFHIAHSDPIAYVYPPVSIAGFPQTLRQHPLAIGAALIGLFVVGSRFAVAWLLTAVALLAYAIAPTPPLVPAFHFWLYSTAAIALLAGSTLAWLCPRPSVFIVATVVLVVWNWSAYSTRNDFVTVRAEALARIPDHQRASAFLRRVTKSDDVVLGTYGAVRLIIGPAGRKTVVADALFSSPYVPFDSRAADRDRMIAAVQAGDLTTLMRLARVYDVSAVVSTGNRDCAAAMQLLKVGWRFGDVCISLLE